MAQRENAPIGSRARLAGWAGRVDLVHLVCFVCLRSLVQPNKPNRPNEAPRSKLRGIWRMRINKRNQPVLVRYAPRPAGRSDFFSILQEARIVLLRRGTELADCGWMKIPRVWRRSVVAFGPIPSDHGHLA